jgi:hypothetical protein
MSRVLASILFFTGLSLIAPPAHAAVSVTISAAPSTLVVGDQAVIKGKAVNAKPGSVVKLQRKVDGTWRAVASKKVWAARTYSFAVKPTRGIHYYRVVKARQLGQAYAQSPIAKVTVTGPLAVTISASPDTLSAGDTATVSGRAVNALPGSMVQLQRLADGSWRAVGATRIGSTRTFTFAVAPVKGYQYYRVVKPRQLGQATAVSPVVTLAVRWRPTVHISSQLSTDPASNERELTIDGSVSERDGVTKLRLERDLGVGRGWELQGAYILDAGGTVRVIIHNETQARFRLVYPGVGLRQTAVSATSSHLPGPQELPVNSSLALEPELEGTYSLLTFNADKGTPLTLAGSGESWSAVIYGPTGEELGAISSAGERLQRFVAPSSGGHTIRVHRPLARTTWFDLSKPKVYDASIDGPAVDASNDFSAQEIELRFQGEAGDLITVERGGDVGNPVLLGPSGSVGTQRWGTPGWGAPDRTEAFQLPETGTYRYRLREPWNYSVSVRLLSAVTAHATLDGARVQLSLDDRSRAAVITFAATKGQAIDLITSDHALPRVFTPSGVFEYGPRPFAQETGLHLAVFWGQDTPSSREFWLASPQSAEASIDGDPVDFTFPKDGLTRSAVVEFAGLAGQVVRMRGEATSGHWGTPAVYAPDGSTVFDGIDSYDKAFLLPMDGRYRLRVAAADSLEGRLELLSGKRVSFPADGTAVPFDVETPGGVAWARVDVQAESVVDLKIADALVPDGYLWLTVSRPNGAIVHELRSSQREAVRFDVPAPGTYYIGVVGEGDATGTIWASQSIVS